MRRVLFCLGLLAILSACGSGRPVAPDDVVDHAAYVDAGPPSLTLMTSIRSETGVGAHSALIINASQRVIFDPAGSYQATIDGQPATPQRGDVIYGVSPPVLAGYLTFQSAKGFHATTITIPVSAAVAEEALRKAEGHGWVSQAFCADATSSLLASLPGLESLHPAIFPRQFMRQVAKLPGVTIKTYDRGVEVPNNSIDGSGGDRHVGAYTDF
ncbi:MAG: hypothetical protein GC186_18380 [Rhodobacteraceae bacterium]|nr:hypothetical protein [Paracoccaceae bacterium]